MQRKTGEQAHATVDANATDFGCVLYRELQEIEKSRALRGLRHFPSDSEDVMQCAHDARLVGLAFSGGGIRSATFNLGVLQGLAGKGLLRIFDYLSTVSGGGYIGSWLAAWYRRELRAVTEDADRRQQPVSPDEIAKTARARVEAGLDAERADKEAKREQRQIEFLRDYSNYLTPRKGIFGADTWTVIMTYLRNLMLNLSILVLALLALLVAGRMSVYAHHFVPDFGNIALFLIAFGLLFVAFVVIVWNLTTLFARSGERYQGSFWKPGRIVIFVVGPILLCAWLLSAWLWTKQVDDLGDWWNWGVWTAAGYGLLWLLGTGFGKAIRLGARKGYRKLGQEALSLVRNYAKLPQRAELKEGTAKLGLAVLFAAVAGSAAGPLLWMLGHIMRRWSVVGGGEAHAATFGMPVVILIFALVGVLHVGLTGRGFSEEAREWWSRLGAYLLLISAAVTVVLAVAVYGPMIPIFFDEISGWINVAVASSWLLTSIAGVLAGKSAQPEPRRLVWSRKALIAVTPYVFILGLLVLLAWLMHAILPVLIKSLSPFAQVTVAKAGGAGGAADIGLGWLSGAGIALYYGVDPDVWDYWQCLDNSLGPGLLVWFASFGILSAFLSYRVGINDFSLHAMYGNRLIRAYLGASNRHRNPQPFTGLDSNDNDVDVSELRPSEGHPGPYPIINAALNLVDTRRLAWQQRKAASFVFTPRYSGYDYVPDPAADTAGAQTSARGNSLCDFAYRDSRGYGEGVSLGKAMAISGAAASPNMGYHTSIPMAILMTVFNVRLGWWLGNPRNEKTWDRPGPSTGLYYLFCELMGATNDRRGYVYLSDGGHFENLAIYELVRRRCRYIVACDAAEDHNMRFGDLGNAIEKCRTDFGIDIEISVDSIRPPEGGRFSRWHCAVGKIRYSRVDRGADDGTLVYIKSSLTGNEPHDVARYAAEHPQFPHEPTTDQWFDESQFESYRQLGQHIIETVMAVTGPLEQHDPVESLFAELRRHWYPPSAIALKEFAKHAAKADNLLGQIRSRAELAFLDAQIYPALAGLSTVHAQRPQDKWWLPATYEETRAGFYMCKQMLQLMESVYHDLHLDRDFHNPDNRGWINLFRRWSGSRMFRFTWAVTASTYGARFQTFCEQRMNLVPGEVRIGAAVGISPDTLRTDEGSKAFWDAAEADYGFNYYERRLLTSFIVGHDDKTENSVGAYEVYPVELGVEDPLADETAFHFTVGFMVIDPAGPQGDKAILYFRIQPEFRMSGLARRSLSALTQDRRFVGITLMLAPEPADGRKPSTEEVVKWFEKVFEGRDYLEIPKETDVARFQDEFDTIARSKSQHQGSPD